MKTIIYMAQSLNGFIAKKDGDTPFCDESWDSYQKICSKHPAVVVGKTTFDLIQEDPSEWDSIGNPFVLVLSSESLSLSGNFASASSPEEALKELEKRGFESVIIGGGAKTNSAFLRAGLVNEIIVDVESQMFASGIPFLDSLIIKKDTKLKLISAEKMSDDLAQLRYSLS